MRPLHFLLAGSLLAGACHPAPGAGPTPDAGLVSRIRRLHIRAPASACPGTVFRTEYTALLDDGRELLLTRGDRQMGNRLSTVILALSSADATLLPDGAWSAERDPLQSLTTGFPVVATLRANPRIADTAVVAPEYSCLPRVYRFSGEPGEPGEPGGPGGDGPAVTVRVGFVRTRFYPTLAVAGIQVGDSQPFYVAADASTVPTRWLTIVSQGGAGGWGSTGAPGRDGAIGADGCPGLPGGNGQNGAGGGNGGAGGRGGPIAIVGPSNWMLFVGLADARSVGGDGGGAGTGGAGGHGGKGGTHVQAAHGVCLDGQTGQDGRPGPPGREGPQGERGPAPNVLMVDAAAVFGADAPRVLRDLARSLPEP